MMVLAKVQVISTLFAVLFTGGARSIDAPIAGYNVSIIPWTVTPSLGAPPQAFEGTIQEVLSSVVKINPNFYQDFKLDNNQATSNAVKRYQAGVFEKRDTWTCTPNPDWHSAHTAGIVQGIKYLRGVPGQPSNGPGPGNCGRVSCTGQSGIWWCNDNDFTKVLPSFNNIADGAQVLVDKCTGKDPYAGAYSFTRGQLFHDDGWNVIVRYEHDC